MAAKLQGRVALVTGASSGIGEATAMALAEAGGRVALVGRRRDRLETVAASVRASGGEARVYAADLLDEQAARQVVLDCEADFGRLDILVNNAGVMYLEPVASADLGRWRQMIELNLLSLIASTQAALAGMKQRGEGHIINIASTAGRIANPNGAGYSATKFGVVAFSEALRKEVYQDRIRVTVIEPGLVATELRDHIADKSVQGALNSWADSLRQLQSEDIADAVVYCATRPAHVAINEMLIRPTDQER
ncbi:SDR family NAD(P)-dependent oxidoreductase [Frateuria aurantia]